MAYGGHYIWCALFVTSQFDVIFMFPNQHFGEVLLTHFICEKTTKFSFIYTRFLYAYQERQEWSVISTSIGATREAKGVIAQPDFNTSCHFVL